MTALDMSRFVNTTDTPEVVALKTKVQEVASRYATKHRWCDEVNKALKECGIEPEKQVVIDVTTSHPFAFTVNAMPSALAGKDEAEQKQVIAGLIGEVGLVSSSGGAVSAGKLMIVPTSIVTMTLREVIDAQVESSTDAPAGYVWRLGGRDARTVHLFREQRNDDRLSRYSTWAPSECGSVSVDYSNLREDTGRHPRCRNCLRSGAVTGN